MSDVPPDEPGEEIEPDDDGTDGEVLALSLATEGAYSEVIALDHSLDALALARINREAVGAFPVRLVLGDLAAPLAESSLDLLVSNPPYLTDAEWEMLDPSVSAWEPREALAEAVTRELREETGLEGVCGPLLGWVERIDDAWHYVILDFEVTLVGDDQPEAGDDAAEVAWVELHDVAEMPLADGLAEFLHDHGIISTFT